MEVTAGIFVKDYCILLMRRAPGQSAAGGWEGYNTVVNILCRVPKQFICMLIVSIGMKGKSS